MPTRNNAITKSNEGFTQIDNRVLMNPDISASAHRLYSVMRSFAWKVGGEICTASQGTLADMVGVTSRQVRTLIHELNDAGVIRIEQCAGRPSVIHAPMNIDDLDGGPRKSTSWVPRKPTSDESDSVTISETATARNDNDKNTNDTNPHQLQQRTTTTERSEGGGGAAAAGAWAVVPLVSKAGADDTTVSPSTDQNGTGETAARAAVRDGVGEPFSSLFF